MEIEGLIESNVVVVVVSLDQRPESPVDEVVADRNCRAGSVGSIV